MREPYGLALLVCLTEGKVKCRAGTLIASAPTLWVQVYPGRRKKILGELKDGGNRRKVNK